MDPVIKSLILKRFRSIPSERVDFENPTFLVGQNGSGKSNFVDALAFIAEAMTVPLQAVIARRGGIAAVCNRTSRRFSPRYFGLCAILGALNGEVESARYAFQVRALPNHDFHVLREQCIVVANGGKRHWFDRKRHSIRFSIEGVSPSLEDTALTLPVIAGDARFAPVLKALAAMRVYTIEPGKMREMQDPDSGASLRPDGSNSASVLQQLERASPDELERICEILATIVPNTTQVRPVKQGNKLSLEFTQEWGSKKRLKFDASNMSDGTLRALGLLMAVFQKPRPALIVIEEPESSIHPGALGAILDLIRHASRTMQIVVTTHSPELLDAKWIEDRHLRLAAWHEGATRITHLAESSREALRQHLMGAGELLRANALDPQDTSNAANDMNGALFEELA